MAKIDFAIVDWFAWMPGLESKHDWTLWANNQKEFSQDFSLYPDINFVAASQRRRLSQLTRMMLKCAFECGKEFGDNKIENVFASRYGEIEQTIKLLQSLTSSNEISPAGFSLSVHNTAAGINSIINKNKASYTAISACEETFETALIEAVGRLENTERVLFVYGDEYVEEMQKLFKTPLMPISLALMIEKNGSTKISAQIKRQKISADEANENVALGFIKWLISQEQNVFQTTLLHLQKNAK